MKDLAQVIEQYKLKFRGYVLYTENGGGNLTLKLPSVINNMDKVLGVFKEGLPVDVKIPVAKDGQKRSIHLYKAFISRIQTDDNQKIGHLREQIEMEITFSLFLNPSDFKSETSIFEPMLGQKIEKSTFKIKPHRHVFRKAIP